MFEIFFWEILFCVRNWGSFKGIVFFYFPGKVCHSLTHSILRNSVFFFQPWEKKNNFGFFFSSEKFVSHSLAIKADFRKKRSKKVKKRYFSKNGGVFYFFPKNSENGLLFFFSWKSLHFTHSLIFKERKKKKQHWKKKTPFLLTHSIFAQK